MDRSRPIDRDATELMPAGDSPADGSAGVRASANGVVVAATVAEDKVTRDEPATEPSSRPIRVNPLHRKTPSHSGTTG